MDDPAAFSPSPYLRAYFTLRTRPISARLYVTAHGLYETSLNGQRTGDAYFTPGYSSYHHRCTIRHTMVGDLLHNGENVAWCDPGRWLVSRFAWDYFSAQHIGSAFGTALAN